MSVEIAIALSQNHWRVGVNVWFEKRKSPAIRTPSAVTRPRDSALPVPPGTAPAAGASGEGVPTHALRPARSLLACAAAAVLGRRGATPRALNLLGARRDSVRHEQIPGDGRGGGGRVRRGAQVPKQGDTAGHGDQEIQGERGCAPAPAAPAAPRPALPLRCRQSPPLAVARGRRVGGARASPTPGMAPPQACRNWRGSHWRPHECGVASLPPA